MSTHSVRATWPENRPTGLNPIQARKAFEPGGGAAPARLVGFDGSIATLEQRRGTVTVRLVIARPNDLATTLAGDDVTRWDGSPLALLNDQLGALAVATGPPTPPAQISVISSVARIAEGDAVEIPSADGTQQPSWQLFAVKTLAPENEGGSE